MTLPASCRCGESFAAFHALCVERKPLATSAKRRAITGSSALAKPVSPTSNCLTVKFRHEGAAGRVEFRSLPIEAFLRLGVRTRLVEPASNEAGGAHSGRGLRDGTAFRRDCRARRRSGWRRFVCRDDCRRAKEFSG